jgi:hypothetical protein
MSLSTETDPVETVRLILNQSAEGLWDGPRGKPTRIAPSGDHTPSEKSRYEYDAVYVYGEGDGSFEPLDGSGDSRTERTVVACDVWCLGSETDVRKMAEDLRLVVRAYWTDNGDETRWTTIRPVTASDYTHETFGDTSSKRHERHLVRIELMRVASV